MEKSALRGWGGSFFGMSGQKSDVMWEYTKRIKILRWAKDDKKFASQLYSSMGNYLAPGKWNVEKEYKDETKIWRKAYDDKKGR